MPSTKFALSPRGASWTAALSLLAATSLAWIIAMGLAPTGLRPNSTHMVLLALVFVLFVTGGIWGFAHRRTIGQTWWLPAALLGLAAFIVANEAFTMDATEISAVVVQIALLTPFLAALGGFLRAGNVFAALACLLFVMVSLIIVFFNTRFSDLRIGFLIIAWYG